MTSQLIDFPMDLALKAYGDNPNPQKRAERDRDDFLAHLAETREKLEEVARTEAQREMVEHQMRVYARTRLAEWTKVLQVRSETDFSLEPDDRRLTPFQQTHYGFLQWDRKYAGRMEQELQNLGGSWVGRVNAQAQAALAQGA